MSIRFDDDPDVRIGVNLPFTRDNKTGWFDQSFTTLDAAKSNLRNLLLTMKGERLMQPNLGIELRSLLFEQIDESTLISIQDTILDSLEFWLPFVEVQDIQILNDDRRTDINQIVVKIIFNIKQNPSTTESVSINFSSDIGDTSDITTAAGY